MDLKDPCRDEPAYERIVGVYFRFIQYGVNYTNKDGLRAATLVGYAKAISTLFTLQGYPSPIDLSDPDNATSIQITNHKKRGHFSAAIPPQLGNPSPTRHNSLLI